MKIQILKCNDALMWYNKLVGTQLVVEREDEDYYWCRESTGFLNIIKKNDATIISLSLADLMPKRGEV